MFTVNPLDNVFDELNVGMNNAGNNMTAQLNQLNQQSQDGILNPSTLLQMEMQMQMYLVFVNVYSSMVKDYADVDKSIAQNIGA